MKEFIEVSSPFLLSLFSLFLLPFHFADH
jgi:hypothetical protein